MPFTSWTDRESFSSKLETRNSKLLPASANDPIDRGLAATGNQQRQRPAETRHRELHTRRHKERGPMHADNRRQHNAGNQKGPDSGQQSQQNQNATHQLGSGGGPKPQPGWSHEGKRRQLRHGCPLGPARSIESPHNFLRAVRDEDSAQRQSQRKRNPQRRGSS